jgi:hypothetical protein
MERCAISPPISRDHRDPQIKLNPKHGVNPEGASDYGQTTEGGGKLELLLAIQMRKDPEKGRRLDRRGDIKG